MKITKIEDLKLGADFLTKFFYRRAHRDLVSFEEVKLTMYDMIYDKSGDRMSVKVLLEYNKDGKEY